MCERGQHPAPGAWGAIATLAVALVACGGGGDATTPAADVAPEVSEDATPDLPEPEDAEPDTRRDFDAGDHDRDGSSEDVPADDVAPDPPDPSCNPVAPHVDCLLPYPSDHFLVDDPSTPSGKRVELPEAARLKTGFGTSFDLMNLHPVDGFSAHQPILALFPGAISHMSLTPQTGPPAIGPTATSVLLRADTGEAVPHWTELDGFEAAPSRRVVIVRSYVRLEPETRYIVAFQNLKGADGRDVSPPDSYLELAQSERYQREILPALREFGVNPADVEMAWDFTTGSDAYLKADMLAMQADAIARMEQTPPRVSDVTVVQPDSEHIALRVEGVLDVPLYLESAETGALLHRGPDGAVAYNGQVAVPFLLQVPRSAIPDAEAFAPARTLQWGHGFFGAREEVNHGFNQRYAQEGRYVMAAVDWWGMSEPDINAIVAVGEDLDRAFAFVDRLHQAMINQLALTRALQTTIAELDAVRRFDQPLYDPEFIHFFGISQGHIFGVAAVALSPWIDRAVLGVGGGPYSLMMSRSANFAQLLGLINLILEDPVMTQKLISLSQHTWDRVDPVTWASHLVREPLPGTPHRPVLTRMGVGDHAVPNLAGELLAREVGVPLLAPAARVPYGFAPEEGPLDSAFVTVDFGVDPLPGLDARLPTQDERNEVHGALRDLEPLKAQVDAFLRPDGAVQNFCEGPCDPE